MKFFCLSVLLPALVWGMPVMAADHPLAKPCDRLCELSQHARVRAPRPTDKPLVCVNFTLPAGGQKVGLRVSRSGVTVIEDSKIVSAREGQFCYPKQRWLRAGGEPDQVYLCSEHSVTLPWKEVPIAIILSGRGNLPGAYACLRGVAGCGGVDGVAVARDRLRN